MPTFLLYTLLINIFLVACQGNIIDGSQFFKYNIFITGSERGCSVDETNILALNNKIRCAAECSLFQGCVGFFWKKRKLCVLHKNACSETLDPSDFDPKDTNYFRRRISQALCQINPNNRPQNEWDSVNSRCICKGGLVGYFCDRYAKTCQELKDAKYPESSKPLKVKLKPPKFSSPRTVFCGLGRDETLTYVAINTAGRPGNMFKAEYPEYKFGIQSKSADQTIIDHFVGLELIHYFTTVVKLTNLAVIVKMKGDNRLRFKYIKFMVKGQEDDFAVSAMDMGITATGDWKKDTSGFVYSPTCNAFNRRYTSIPFDTKDNFCLPIRGIRWWFKDDCEKCNFLGKFYNSKNDPTDPKRVSVPGFDLQSMFNLTTGIHIVLTDD